MDYELEILRLQKDIDSLEKEAKDNFVTLFANHSVPDRLPPSWSKSYFKINVPFDFIDENNLSRAVIKLIKIIHNRKDKRILQAKFIEKMNYQKILDNPTPRMGPE